jgi:hypothetical protein
MGQKDKGAEDVGIGDLGHFWVCERSSRAVTYDFLILCLCVCIGILFK